MMRTTMRTTMRERGVEQIKTTNEFGLVVEEGAEVVEVAQGMAGVEGGEPLGRQVSWTNPLFLKRNQEFCK